MIMTRISLRLLAMSAILATAFMSCSCDKNGGKTEGEDQLPVEPEVFEVNYTESDEDFINPERGLYTQFTIRFDDGNIPSPVSLSSMETQRFKKQSLTLTLFYLTDFMNGDISDDALEVIRQSLQAHRNGGCKAVLRFAYKSSDSNAAQPWDPEVDVVLRHVEQLAPIFKEYGDVIYVLQAGFVGAWGEWYYTTNFTRNPTKDEDWTARRKLVRALLDAMPENRQIAMRTGEYKLECIEMEVADSITAKTAFNGSDISRLAGHNDCFLADGTDMGTFSREGERPLWMTETNYASMGGETCAAVEAYCKCEKALKACEDYHWSYLNSGYNTATHNIWRKGDCYDEIVLRLGYRLVLRGADFGDDYTAGAEFPIHLKIDNVGFASLINEHELELVLVQKGNADKKYVFTPDVDPRTWKGGKSSYLDYTLTLPADLEPGEEYNLYINICDAAETLKDDPRFSVRFANEGVWDETTGYNLLTSFKAE